MKIVNPMSLEGKKILVAGASSGIGRETAILLSKLGADLVLVGRREIELQNTLKSLETGNNNYIIYDLYNLDNIEDLMRESVNIDGEKLDGLVYSAGIASILPLKNIDYDYMDRCMRINFYAFIELVKFYSLKKYSNGGSVVAISSIASICGEKCQTIYSASKAALDASIRTLAQELVKKNIRLNTVRPGAIDTGNGNITLEMEEILKKQILGVGSPKDIANIISFLLSDASRFITGRFFEVDGGRF